jgi:branched-chain amino acid transport system substrate-binding protein
MMETIVKKIFLGFVTSAVVVVASGSAGAQQVRGVYPDRVVFGMQTDLSGPVANVGVAQSNAIRMRFAEVNQAGGVHGRKLELVVEDSGYQIPKAVQAVNKLINRDKVFALIGSMASGPNNATLPTQIAANVPNLFPNAATRSMFEPHHTLKFANLVTYMDQARSSVKWMVEQRGVKKVCVLAIKSDMGDEVFEGVVQQSKVHKLPAPDVAYHRPTDVEFSASVMKMKDAGCGGLMLGTLARDTVGILSAVKALRWDIPVIGAAASQEPAVVEAPGGIAEGYMVASLMNTAYTDDQNKQAAAWVQQYAARYKQHPSVYGQWAYTWADLTVKGLQNAGRNLNVDTFVAGLEAIRDYQDIFGSPKLSFGKTRHMGASAIFLVAVENGRFVRITDPLKF